MSKRRNRKRSRVVVPSTGITTKITVDHRELSGFALTEQEIRERFRNASIGEQLFAIARLNALFEAGIDSHIIVQQVMARSQDSP